MLIKNHNLLESTFIIAELSCNHLNDINIVMKTIEAIAKTGANALKVQTMLPETMTLNCTNQDFVISGGTAWDGMTFWDLYQEVDLPLEWHEKIKQRCDELGLIFFSTPFGRGFDNIPDPTDFLEKLGVPCYKIASFEITDIPLIKHVASKKKPIIMSTGVAEYNDIKLAVEACKSVGNEEIILLKCTSAYPTPVEEVNLRQMVQMKNDFETLVGISDHSMFDEVAISSVALGGCVIEKHVILDRKLGGPDAGFSMEPHEFKKMVDSVRKTEKLLGKANYDLTDNQKNSRNFARSLYIVKDVKAGDIITNENIRSIRPGFGLHPMYLDNQNPKCILGKKFSLDIAKNNRLELKHVNQE